jgi:predicted  nucleic acid-binding Zn-ribbon protein
LLPVSEEILAIGEFIPGQRGVRAQRETLKPSIKVRIGRIPDSKSELLDGVVKCENVIGELQPKRTLVRPLTAHVPSRETGSSEETIRITRIEFEEEELSSRAPTFLHSRYGKGIAAPANSPILSPRRMAYEDLRRIVILMRKQIAKLHKTIAKRDKEIDDLKAKIGRLTGENQQKKLDLIRADEKKRLARLEYKNLQLRFEVVSNEFSNRSEELAKLRREVMELRGLAAPAFAKYSRLCDAREEQRRILRERTNRRAVLTVAERAMDSVKDAETRRHLQSVVENTERSLVRLEARRAMWKEVERKQMMSTLGALSLIDENPMFEYRIPPISSFRKNRLQMTKIFLDTVRGQREGKVHDVKDFVKGVKRSGTHPSYAKSLEMCDQLDPPLSKEEKETLVRGEIDSNVIARIRAKEDEVDSGLSLEGIVVTGK